MLSRVSLAAGAAALSLTMFAISASAQSWRKHDYRNDGFAVDFSGQINIAPTAVAEEAKERIIRSTNYLQDNGSSAYIVGATLAKYRVEFEKGVEASFNAMKCKIKINDTTLNFPNGKAREISASDCTDDGSLALEARYFEMGKWFYQVMAIYPKGGDKSEALHFVTSFEVRE